MMKFNVNKFENGQYMRTVIRCNDRGSAEYAKNRLSEMFPTNTYKIEVLDKR